jgi:hypothetical protein
MSTPDLAGTWTLLSFNPTFVTGTSEEHEFIAGALDLTLRTAPDPFYLEGDDWVAR